jgi:hypothetical protein
VLIFEIKEQRNIAARKQGEVKINSIQPVIWVAKLGSNMK